MSKRSKANFDLSREIVVREERQVAGDMRGRPPIRKRMFYCCKCRREPQEIGHYAAEAFGHGLDPGVVARMGIPVIDCGQGYIHGYAKCHGNHCEFRATYAQAWAAIDLGQLIRIFDPIEDLPDRQEIKRLQ